MRKTSQQRLSAGLEAAARHGNFARAAEELSLTEGDKSANRPPGIAKELQTV